MSKKDWKKDIFTIPNMLSVFRLVLIPVYVVIYLGAETLRDHLVAGGILAVSCFTDLLDGKIARHFNMISTTGKILDPLADKATQFTMIICLLLKYPVLKWLVILFVVKELFQLTSGIISLRKGKVLKGALLSGKISTTILFVSLITMVMVPQLEIEYVQLISAVDAIFLLIAMIDYGRAYFTENPMLQTVEEELGRER